MGTPAPVEGTGLSGVLTAPVPSFPEGRLRLRKVNELARGLAARERGAEIFHRVISFPRSLSSAPSAVSNLSTVTWDHLRSLKALRSLSLTDFEMREPVL